MAQSYISFLLNVLAGLGRRWLLFTNLGLGLFIGLPIAAPVLAANGRSAEASAIYDVYQLTCHQMPQRSFFLYGPQITYSLDELQSRQGASESWLAPLSGFHGRPDLGYAVAFCERNTAIYASMLLAGLAFGLVRRRIRPLPISVLITLAAPMALDGLTQLVGGRESTPILRLVTGSLFGMGAILFVFPYLGLAMRELVAEIETALAFRQAPSR